MKPKQRKITLTYIAILGMTYAQASAATPATTFGNEQPEVTPEQVAEIQTKAQAGDARSQAMLGDLYSRGLGLDQNHQQAFEWYQKAAQAGDSYGITQVGLMYMLGQGIDIDYEKGKDYLLQTAENDPKAAFNLGVYYLNIADDNWLAMKWIEKASTEGLSSAVSALDLLNKDLKFLPGASLIRYPIYKKVSLEAVTYMQNIITKEKQKECAEGDGTPPRVISTIKGGSTLSSYKELWTYDYCDEKVLVPVEFTLDAGGETNFAIAKEFITIETPQPAEDGKQ